MPTFSVLANTYKLGCKKTKTKQTKKLRKSKPGFWSSCALVFQQFTIFYWVYMSAFYYFYKALLQTRFFSSYFILHPLQNYTHWQFCHASFRAGSVKTKYRPQTHLLEIWHIHFFAGKAQLLVSDSDWESHIPQTDSFPKTFSFYICGFFYR